jgi:hypothetical protein
MGFPRFPLPSRPWRLGPTRVLGATVLVSAAALGGLVAGRGLAFVPQKVIEGPLTLANFVRAPPIALTAASGPRSRWWTPTCMCAPLAGLRFPIRI